VRPPEKKFNWPKSPKAILFQCPKNWTGNHNWRSIIANRFSDSHFFETIFLKPSLKPIIGSVLETVLEIMLKQFLKRYRNSF